MRVLLILLAATAMVAPARAQDPHAGHAGHAPARPAQAGKPASTSSTQATTQTPVGDGPAVDCGPQGTSGLPCPTRAEVDAAFPDLDGRDMREHMGEEPLVATLALHALETPLGRGAGDAWRWDARGWIGHTLDRAWLRSHGETQRGHRTHGDVELLWGHATGPWWDRMLGLRQDVGAGPARTWLAVGVQGLAPYKFEVAATAYLGTGGRSALRLQVAYEWLLTNRLILEPELEANVYGRSDRARDVRAGIDDIAAGLRLRYEITRQFAPYVGYERSHRPGRAPGQRGDGSWVAGIRGWL